MARLLVENNAADEQTARQVHEIYRSVQLRAYTFLAATLAEVLAAYHATFAAVAVAVENAPTALLLQQDYSPWNNGVPFAYLVAANTCWHYAEHVQALAAWADLHPTNKEMRG